MCSWCNTGGDYCFCGTPKDAANRGATCGAQPSSEGFCTACGHTVSPVRGELPPDVVESGS